MDGIRSSESVITIPNLDELAIEYECNVIGFRLTDYSSLASGGPDIGA